MALFYTTLGVVLPKTWEEAYKAEYYELREEFGLPQLSDSYKLDSTIIDVEGVHIQYWSLIEGKRPSQPFHFQKIFYYSKSFWLWENEYYCEVNNYKIIASPEAEIELSSMYTYEFDSVDFHIDIWYTEYGLEIKRYQDSIAIDYAEKNNLYLCGSSFQDSEYAFYPISRSEFDSILTKWSRDN